MARGEGTVGVFSAVIRSDKMDSSAIATAQYDAVSKFLTLRFNSGALYQYSNVDADTYQGFLDADSKGRYFKEHIDGVHVHKRLA